MERAPFGSDTLVDIGTFLARRWSGMDGVTVEFSDRGENRARVRERRIILIPAERLAGDGFQRYRQFRASLWYESMRLQMCSRILSSDHAFGFILNALETRRIELAGRETWRGMDTELMLHYSFQWNYRPLLSSVYGRARIVEAFYQYLLFGDIKGEIQPSLFERVRRAVGLARGVLDRAVEEGHGTDWLEKRIPDIIRILDIDPLVTVPVALPWMKPGMALSEEELLRALVRVSRNRDGDFGRVDPDAVIRGEAVAEEYRVLVDEGRKSENRGLGNESIGVRVPSRTGVDETAIYDPDLINRLRNRFRDWRSGWKEEHLDAGDEFDEESYLEGHKPFFTDVRKAIRIEIMIMLDHSSSIASEQLRYKKATLALCEVLAYLKVRFSVYAFSTADRAVVCWLIKPDIQKWNSVCAKRLAQIAANGSTPLAEVYDKMYETIQAKRPEIFLTLTDGEPGDPGAVHAMIKSIRSLGVRMVAIGLGSDIVRSTAIAKNLKRLGYERTLAVSRLEDIPNRVVGLLGEG